MNRKNRFNPSAIEKLEDRVVLTQGHLARGVSVVVSGLTPRQQVLNSRQLPIIAEVNQAFASFLNDYGQARAAYYASIVNQTQTSPATMDAINAFRLYTTERVSLLAQQLISSFLQSTQGTSVSRGSNSTLKQLINSKIINPASINAGNSLPNGVLIQSLVTSIPTAGASASTESLYTLSQNFAIQSAQASMINGANIIKYGDFGNHVVKHK